MIGRIDPAARDFNVQEFDKPVAAAVQAACETLPFFAESRLVICREMPESEAKQLIGYAPTMPPTTTLILYVRGKCGASLLQAVKGMGRDVLFDRLTESDALRFVQQRVRKRESEIDREAAQLLVDMVGTQVHALQNELNKAADYAGPGGIVTAQIVRACVTPNMEFKRFVMLDELLAGKQQSALQALRHMLRDGSETPFGLAYFFTGQCKNMLGARLLMDSGMRESEVGRRLGLSAMPAKTAVAGARRLSREQLRAATLAFSAIDHLQVTGKMPSDRALEMAVLRYFCSGRVIKGKAAR